MQKCCWLVIATASLVVCVSAMAFDPGALGDIQGITRNPDGEPVPNATVTVHNVEEKSDRTITCGGDGWFSVEHLKPGKYQLTAKTEKFFTPNASVVYLEPGTVAKVEMPLIDSRAATEQADVPPLTNREKQLLDRIDRLEARLATLEARDANATLTAAVTTPGTQVLVASLKPVAAFPQTAPSSSSALGSGAAPAPQSTAA